MTPQERYEKLKEHLLEENPVLVDVIDEYKELDEVAKKIGLLDENQTYTEFISWWPLISILGTFSAGKSSFINEYLGKKVQDTGNQAVDDKFTVICYSKNDEVTTLPGVALDADPRFPFYNISKEIEKIDPEERNINKFLQLKAVNSERIKGKILIDSPGFDADFQRDAVLRITKHIIDLSDLVLIFFDARHPEPGAMRDTLNHLVELAKKHSDSDKVLYVLNQIDTCAKEDNLEEIIGAWQRALSQKGIVSGKFYAIYNESLAKIDNPEIAERLKKRKDEDLAQITEKMEKVTIDRAYRIVKNIETKAKEIMDSIPELKKLLGKFRTNMLIADALMLAIFGAGSYFASTFVENTLLKYGIYALAFILFVLAHFRVRSLIVKHMAKKIDNEYLRKAFLKHTKWYKPYLLAGMGIDSQKIKAKLEKLIEDSRSFIQKLNDQFISLKKEKSNFSQNQEPKAELPEVQTASK
ncbi:MAG: dynamin family protein [Aquificae bacterium]|nr:dynamin family protein [Aquificota bacterium]